jgi:DNA-binding transcriptional LysR family regulator
VETDSVASLYAHVATGAWASVVPHTWLRAMPVTGGTRAVPLVNPDARAQISVAIHAATPGSVAARAFLDVVAGLSLDEVFEPYRLDVVADLPNTAEGALDRQVVDARGL